MTKKKTFISPSCSEAIPKTGDKTKYSNKGGPYGFYIETSRVLEAMHQKQWTKSKYVLLFINHKIKDK